MSENAGPIPVLRPDLRISPFHENGSHESRDLVRMGGRHFVVSSELGALLRAILSGMTSTSDIRKHLSEEFARDVSIDDITAALDAVRTTFSLEATTEDVSAKSRNIFWVRCRVLNPTIANWLAGRCSTLFRLPFAIPIFLLEVTAAIVLVFRHGTNIQSVSPLFSGACILAILIASVLWHEIGHASACRFFGEKPGEIGFGMYLCFPAFFADVSSAWSLPSHRRFIVDIAGVYFQGMFFIPLAVWSIALSGAMAPYAAWIIGLMMLQTANPVFKMDGYWALSDLSGLTNLHRRVLAEIKALLRISDGPRSVPSLNGVQRIILPAYVALASAYFFFIVHGLSVMLAIGWSYASHVRPL